MRTIQDVLNRLRGEFMEMPGLRLTAEQVRRLCGIERSMCHVVLDLLLESKFLFVTPDGHYARLTTGHHPHPAKADLRTDTRAQKASWATCEKALVQEEYRMVWIAAVATVVAGIMLFVVIRAKRPSDVDQLGAVSEQWIAQHRVNPPWARLHQETPDAS
jgi:hypothetical protein